MKAQNYHPILYVQFSLNANQITHFLSLQTDIGELGLGLGLAWQITRGIGQRQVPAGETCDI
jgi:hypothetical protein